MLTNISNIVNIIAIFQLLLLAYIVLSNNYKSISNRLLFSFLMVNSFLVISNLLYNYEYLTRNESPYLFFIIKSSFLFLGPLVYLYTKSKCYDDFNSLANYRIHFISFVILLSFFILDYYIRLNKSDGTNIEAYTILSFQVFWIFFLVQLLAYIILSFKILKKYNTSLKTFYSNTDKIDLNWLKLLLVVYLFHWFFDALSPLFYIAEVYESYPYQLAEIFSLISLIFFTTFIVVHGLKKNDLFGKINEKSKYSDSPLTDEKSEEYLQKLVSLVENSKVYLNPQLKLSDLSTNLSIPEKQISQVLNQRLGKNFFDFINSYRIDEVKKNLSASSHHNGNGISKNLLEIALMAGFNSKTAFNRSFKKITGKTPSEYKSSLN